MTAGRAKAILLGRLRAGRSARSRQAFGRHATDRPWAADAPLPTTGVVRGPETGGYGIPRSRRGAGQDCGVVLMAVIQRSQTDGDSARTAAWACLESRTRTDRPVQATSTQSSPGSPLWVLLRQLHVSPTRPSSNLGSGRNPARGPDRPRRLYTPTRRRTASFHRVTTHTVKVNGPNHAMILAR